MSRAASSAFLFVIAACAGGSTSNKPVSVAPDPALTPSVAAPSVVEPASTTASPSRSEAAPAEDPSRPLEPYRLTVVASTSTAATSEDVTVTWKIDGGPRRESGIVPRVQILVDWKETISAKTGTSVVLTSTQTFSDAAAECVSGPTTTTTTTLDQKIAFQMQPKRSAFVRAAIVGCRDRTAVEETRAKAETRVEWVAPYIADLQIPAVLFAGAAAQGTVKFKGLDGGGGTKSVGAPKVVKVTSSNPGVSITRQPTVGASSTFDIAVRPNASGEAKLIAEHVNTDGGSKVLGVLRKTAIVEIRPPPVK